MNTLQECLSILSHEFPEKPINKLEEEVFIFWYRTLSEKCLKNKSDPRLFEDQFMRIKSNAERVASVLSNPRDETLLKSSLNRLFWVESKERLEKSSQKAGMRRAEGDELFESKDFEKALDAYNEAIVWVPQEPPHMLLSIYDKRSQTYYELNRFKDAINDIEEALTLINYSKREEGTDEEEAILLVRKVKCLKFLGRNEEALKVAKTVKTEHSLKRKLLKVIECQADLPTDENIEEREVVLTLKEQNVKLFGANKGVKMSYSLSKGRSLEATQEIAEGSILVIEKAFVSWLSPFCSSRYCHFCLKALNGRLIPCFNCTAVRFCSKSCSTESWRLFHRIECPLVERLNYLSSGQMALRMVVKNGLQEVIRLEREPLIASYKWPDKAFSNDLRSVCSLPCSSDRMDFLNVYSETIGAAVLTLIAEKMSIITGNDEKAIVGGFLLKSLILLNVNTFTIYDQELKYSPYKGILSSKGKEKSIGFAFYGTSSLLNHSCSPNVYKISLGSQMVLISSQPIKPGEEICVSYALSTQRKSLKERQLYLKKFNFECNCSLCLNREERPSFRCPECDGNLVINSDIDNGDNQCMRCGNKNKDLTFLADKGSVAFSHLETGLVYFSQGSLDEAEESLLACQRIYDKIYQPENVKFHALYESLSLCYQFMRKYTLSTKYRLQLIHIEKIISGENSFEVLLHFVRVVELFLEQSKKAEEAESASLLKEAEKYLRISHQIFTKILDMEFKKASPEQIRIISKLNHLSSALKFDALLVAVNDLQIKAN